MLPYFYRMKKMIFFAFLITGCGQIFAQSSLVKYKAVDDKVAALGPLTAFNVATIADTITAPFRDNEQKARAIFYWIANNISIDPKGTKQNDAKNNLPERVIELRKATPLGFSLLVQEMCSDANIRCISVDGNTKKDASEINEAADEINASWNVVQLGKSPETWYFVDAFRAAGSTDKKMTAFTKNFTSEYFFADRTLFNLASYPDNSAWQLGGGPKSVSEFYALPVFSNNAFALDMAKPTPAAGFIKAKLNKAVNFSFNTSADIKSISITMGDDKRQTKPEAMKFDNKSGLVSFSYQFKKEDSYPLRISADGKEILQYMVEVTE